MKHAERKLKLANNVFSELSKLADRINEIGANMFYLKTVRLIAHYRMDCEKADVEKEG